MMCDRCDGVGEVRVECPECCGRGDIPDRVEDSREYQALLRRYEGNKQELTDRLHAVEKERNDALIELSSMKEHPEEFSEFEGWMMGEG